VAEAKTCLDNQSQSGFAADEQAEYSLQGLKTQNV